MRDLKILCKYFSFKFTKWRTKLLAENGNDFYKNVWRPEIDLIIISYISKQK